ncbi:hypothetical protein AB6A40_007457 [Gnathostoma spinigerum]|uniref:Uncharacterized protein n=1 Tax=Gnathostoma spinigerum TaxID=75299 RepID=A0ABD6ELJ8_9BILA
MLNTDIKKEVDDGPEEGKSGYNDVLQWLFRNHPNSPAPASTSSTTPSNNIFRPIDGHKRPTVNSNSGSNSNNSSDNNNNSNSNNNNNNNSNRRSSNGPDDPDPPLARAALYAYRRDTPDSSADEVYENSSESPYTNNVGVGYSPLADGVAECDLRSSAGGSQSDSRGGGGGGTGGTESCVPSFAFGTDYASESMSSSLRVSTIPSADGYPLSNGENLSGESEQRVDDLYPGLSPASSRYGGGQMNGTYDNYANRNNRPQTMVCNGMCKTSREDLLDNPVIQMLAPFVSQEDVMQLTTDIHGLLPDFSELIPPDPSSLPLSPSESRDMCASSQSGTGMTSVVVSPISSSHDSSYSKRSSASSLMGSQCDGFPSNNVAPSQWLEQEYRMPTAVVSGVANGYTWTELGVRASDTVLPSFHRDAVPTFQQQRV